MSSLIAAAAIGTAISWSAVAATVSILVSQAASRQAADARERAAQAADAAKGARVVAEGDPQSLPVIYGRAIVGGLRAYSNTYNYYNTSATDPSSYFDKFDHSNGKVQGAGSKHEWLVTQQALAVVATGSSLNAIKEIYIDDKKMFGEYVDQYNIVMEGASTAGGTLTDPFKDSSIIWVDRAGGHASPLISASTCGDSTRTAASFTNVAFATGVFKLNRDEPQYNGIPAMSFEVEGNKVYDVTSSYALSASRSYSTNPALCLLDYLTNPIYGRGLATTSIDLKSFYEAARLCEKIKMSVDEGYVSKLGVRSQRISSVPLFSCNVVLSTSNSLRDNINQLLETMPGAKLIWSGGTYKLQTAYPYAFATKSGAFTIGAKYAVKLLGTTDFTAQTGGANTIDSVFTASSAGSATTGLARRLYAADQIYIGVRYQIHTVGTTDFVALGAASNTAGLYFTATAIATVAGTGLLQQAVLKGDLVEFNGAFYKSLTNDIVATPAIGANWVDGVAAYITDDSIVREGSTDLTWPSASSKFNFATIKFLNSRKFFKEDSVSWPVKSSATYAAFLASDSGIQLETESFGTGIVDFNQALALAEYTVRASRDIITYSVGVNRSLIGLEPGDIVNVKSNVLNIPGEYIRLSEVAMQDSGVIQLSGTRFDASSYNWAAVTSEIVLPRKLYNFDLPDVTDLAFVNSTVNQNLTSGVLSWTAPDDSRVTGYYVKGKLSTGALWEDLGYVPRSTQTLIAGSFKAGYKYKIITAGSPSLGTVGALFTATGTETGTGTARVFTDSYTLPSMKDGTYSLAVATDTGVRTSISDGWPVVTQALTEGLSNSISLTVYTKSATVLTVAPTGGSFDFKTNTLTAPTSPITWYASIAAIPASTNALYYCEAIVKDPGTPHVQSSIAWSAPTSGTATFDYIGLSSAVTTKDSVNAATSGTYASVTASALRVVGSAPAADSGYYLTAQADTDGSEPTTGTASTLVIAPAAGTSYYTVRLRTSATLRTAATLLDTQVVRTIFAGATGASAAYVSISAPAYVFTRADITAAFTGSILLTATPYGGSASYVWKSSSDGFTSVISTASTYTVPNGASTTSMTYRAYATISGTVYQDELTVAWITGGTNATYAYLTNSSVTLNADVSGGGVSFGTAGGTMKVFQGTTDVTTSSGFGVASATSATATINATTGVYSVSALSADSGSVTYQCTSPNGTVINLVQTLSKSRVGATGSTGGTGLTGTRGSRTLFLTNAAYVAGYGSTNYANAATSAIAAACTNPTTPINGDQVVFTDGSTYAYTITHNGSAWVPPGTVIDGNLLVTGTVTGNKLVANTVTATQIDSRSLSIKDAAGAVLFSSGVPLGSANMATGQGGNLVPNSAMDAGAANWAVTWNQGGGTAFTAPQLDLAGDNWRPGGGHNVGVQRVGTTGAASGYFDISYIPLINILGGKRYEASAYLASHRCGCEFNASFYSDVNATAYISETGWARVSSTNNGGNDLNSWERVGGFFTAPTNAVCCQVRLRSYAATAADPYAWITKLFLAQASSNQIELSPWSDGPRVGAFSELNKINSSNISTYIDNVAIGTAQIADATVTTLKIGTEQVTIPRSVNGSSGVLAVDTWVTMASITADFKGQPVIFILNFNANSYVEIDSWATTTVIAALYEGTTETALFILPRNHPIQLSGATVGAGDTVVYQYTPTAGTKTFHMKLKTPFTSAVDVTRSSLTAIGCQR
jgi:hypothetical protein